MTELIPPIACLLLIAAGFFAFLRSKSRGPTPFLELGGFYCIVVLLYTILPTCSFVVRNLVGTDTVIDARFSESPIDVDEIAIAAWWCVAYLAAFCIAYGLTRGDVPSVRKMNLKPPLMTVPILVAYLAVISTSLLVLGLYFDIHGETYNDSYLIQRDLPLAARYLFSDGRTASTTIQLLLIVAAFSNFQRYRWFVVGLLVYALIESFSMLHSRTDLAVLLVASVILYHRTVKPLKFPYLVALGCTGLFILLLFGVLRARTNNAEGGDVLMSMAVSSGEFESVMANGIDMARKRQANLIQELSLHDIYFAPLTFVVPQPLLPFPKFSAGVWYAATFYAASYEQGFGFAFGAISEAIIGFGILDMVGKAAIVGFVFAQLHRYYIRKAGSFWLDTFYLWLLIFSYQCFRDVAFSLVYLALHRFFLVWIAVQFFTRFAKAQQGPRTQLWTTSPVSNALPQSADESGVARPA